MLLKLLEHMKPAEILRKQYIGEVVDNEDPRRLGRVKCRVDGLWDGEAAALPWVFPLNPPGQGGRGDTSAVECPEVGATLVIEFPFGDVYSPFYTGFWQSDVTHQGEFDEDYPNTRGWRDSDGTFFKVNTAKRQTDFQHAAGGRVRFASDGAIELVSPRAVRIMSEDGKTMLALDSVAGEVSMTNRDEGKLSGATTKIASKRHTVETGSVDDRASGSREVRTGGGYKHIIAGGSSEAVVGNKALSVGGDVDETVVGAEKRIVGLGKEETVAMGGDAQTIIEGDRTINLTLGNFKVSVLAGNIQLETLAGSAKMGNPIGSVEVDATGNITAKNMMGEMTISTAGDISLKNTVGGGLHIDPLGMVALGSSAAELLDLFDKTLDAIMAMTVGTGTGPSSIALNLPQFQSVKTMLLLIKGTL